MINCGKIEPCPGCPAIAGEGYEVHAGETIIKPTAGSFRVVNFNVDPVEIGGIAVNNESYEDADINNSSFRHDIAACDHAEISYEKEVHGRWPFRFTKIRKMATCLALHETTTLRITNG